jgi:hypothetical protein
MPKGDNFHKIQSFFENISNVHWLSFTMGIAAIILLASMQVRLLSACYAVL